MPLAYNHNIWGYYIWHIPMALPKWLPARFGETVSIVLLNKDTLLAPKQEMWFVYKSQHDPQEIIV